MKKILRTLLPVILCLLLAGCRTRTETGAPATAGETGTRAGEFRGSLAAPPAEEETDPDGNPGEQEKNAEPGERTRENPEASRKEYDENRPAEILPGTERTIHEDGEGSGLSGDGENADRTAAKLNGEADATATRKVSAEEAERLGVSDEGEKADSAETYFSVLLRERAGSLFECQRLTVYWEKAEDHLTVFKNSPEHGLILEAGAYDVSARLLEGNLRVDDGWIGRKNPGVVVKTVGRNVLGTGVASTDAARRVYAQLLSRDGWAALDAVKNKRVLLLSEELAEAPQFRLAALLLIAKTANPDLYADVNADDALAMLGEETAGGSPNGIFYFTEQGGF